MNTLAVETEHGHAHVHAHAHALRILHVVDESLPLVSGYAVRTSGIVGAQLALGDAPVVVSGPNHQVRYPGATDEVINSVRYLRTQLDEGIGVRALRGRWPVARELYIVRSMKKRILRALASEHFDIVHSHSPVLCGLAALQAAKRMGVPFVYEIRAFWEDAAVDQDKTSVQSARYHVSRAMEQYVVQHAHAVVGIAASILSELKQRGVDQRKLFHVPNGVDTTKFQPMARNSDLADKLGLGDSPVLGFIGSLFNFEGISWLVRATVELHKRGADFNLLLIGHGEDEAQVRQEIANAGAESYIIFAGTVPHEQIRDYYSVIDVLVYPRRSVRLTELVTPLKPLEAMALGRTVLGSSVGGVRELVRNGDTGVLFAPEDIDDFCLQTQKLLADPEWRRALAERAREMVLREKQWTAIASRYQKVYEFAQGSFRASM